MMWGWNLHVYQSTSLTESRKALEAHGYRSWRTNLPIIPHTLSVLTTNITYCITLLEYVNECQVNVHVANLAKYD